MESQGVHKPHLRAGPMPSSRQPTQMNSVVFGRFFSFLVSMFCLGISDLTDLLLTVWFLIHVLAYIHAPFLKDNLFLSYVHWCFACTCMPI